MGRIKRFSLYSAIVISFFVGLLGLGISSGTYAVDCVPDPADPLKCFCENVRNGEPGSIVEEGGESDICDTSDVDRGDEAQGLLGEEGIVKRVLDLMTWLTGFLAVIYILIGGFKFITSGGDSDSVASAKKMIIFALVGVVVVILSNVIISFVIGLVNAASR